MKVEDLRKEFESEEFINWTNSQGEPDVDYVNWLEKKCLSKEQSNVLSDETIHQVAVKAQEEAIISEGRLKGLKFDFNLCSYKDGMKKAREILTQSKPVDKFYCGNVRNSADGKRCDEQCNPCKLIHDSLESKPVVLITLHDVSMHANKICYNIDPDMDAVDASNEMAYACGKWVLEQIQISETKQENIEESWNSDLRKSYGKEFGLEEVVKDSEWMEQQKKWVESKYKIGTSFKCLECGEIIVSDGIFEAFTSSIVMSDPVCDKGDGVCIPTLYKKNTFATISRIN